MKRTLSILIIAFLLVFIYAQAMLIIIRTTDPWIVITYTNHTETPQP